MRFYCKWKKSRTCSDLVKLILIQFCIIKLYKVIKIILKCGKVMHWNFNRWDKKLQVIIILYEFLPNNISAWVTVILYHRITWCHAASHYTIFNYEYYTIIEIISMFSSVSRCLNWFLSFIPESDFSYPLGSTLIIIW